LVKISVVACFSALGKVDGDFLLRQLTEWKGNGRRRLVCSLQVIIDHPAFHEPRRV
jgi:hypothetical protein